MFVITLVDTNVEENVAIKYVETGIKEMAPIMLTMMCTVLLSSIMHYMLMYEQ